MMTTGALKVPGVVVNRCQTTPPPKQAAVQVVGHGEAWTSRLRHWLTLGKSSKHACLIRDAYFGDAWTSADMVDCILAYAAGVLVNLLTDPTSAEARPMLDALRADPRAAKQLLVRASHQRFPSAHCLLAEA